MISIIIVNYNVKKHLELCLKKITESVLVPEYEIILIDNASDIGIEEFKSDKINVFSLNENLGFSKAVNFGISHSIGDTILLLNPDTLIKNDTISLLSMYLNTDLNVGVVGCKVLNTDGTYQLSSKRKFPNIKVLFSLFFKLNFVLPRSKFFGAYNYTFKSHDELLEVDSISGSCMMFKKDVFQKIDKFDENYFLYFEDTDFCLRLKDAGYKVVYNPVTSIIHHKGESFKSCNTEVKNEFYNSMSYFFKKHKDKYPYWRFVLFFIPLLVFFSTYLNQTRNKRD